MTTSKKKHSNVGIWIGHEASDRTAMAVAKAIIKILAAGHANHMDQVTVQAALATLQHATSINGTSIHGCTIGSLSK